MHALTHKRRNCKIPILTMVPERVINWKAQFRSERGYLLKKRAALPPCHAGWKMWRRTFQAQQIRPLRRAPSISFMARQIGSPTWNTDHLPPTERSRAAAPTLPVAPYCLNRSEAEALTCFTRAALLRLTHLLISCFQRSPGKSHLQRNPSSASSRVLQLRSESLSGDESASTVSAMSPTNTNATRLCSNGPALFSTGPLWAIP